MIDVQNDNFKDIRCIVYSQRMALFRSDEKLQFFLTRLFYDKIEIVSSFRSAIKKKKWTLFSLVRLSHNSLQSAVRSLVFFRRGIQIDRIPKSLLLRSRAAFPGTFTIFPHKRDAHPIFSRRRFSFDPFTYTVLRKERSILREVVEESTVYNRWQVFRINILYKELRSIYKAYMSLDHDLLNFKKL